MKYADPDSALINMLSKFVDLEELWIVRMITSKSLDLTVARLKETFIGHNPNNSNSRESLIGSTPYWYTNMNDVFEEATGRYIRYSTNSISLATVEYTIAKHNDEHPHWTVPRIRIMHVASQPEQDAIGNEVRGVLVVTKTQAEQEAGRDRPLNAEKRVKVLELLSAIDLKPWS